MATTSSCSIRIGCGPVLTNQILLSCSTPTTPRTGHSLNGPGPRSHSRSGSRNDHSYLSDGMWCQCRRPHSPDRKGFFRYRPYFGDWVDGAWQTLPHVFLSCSREVWEVHGALARPHCELVCHREIVPQYSFVISNLRHYKVPFYGPSSQGHGESRAAQTLERLSLHRT